MRNVYFLVKFWLLIKVAHVKLRKIKVGFVGEEQEKFKNFLLGLIDRISSFVMFSHSAKLCKICRKFSEDLVDISVRLRETYSFPVWDNVVYYASDLKNLTYKNEREERDEIIISIL